jgi:hypothetical protein
MVTARIDDLRVLIDRTLDAYGGGDDRYGYAAEHLLGLAEIDNRPRSPALESPLAMTLYFIAAYAEASRGRDANRREVRRAKRLTDADAEAVVAYAHAHPGIAAARKRRSEAILGEWDRMAAAKR